MYEFIVQSLLPGVPAIAVAKALTESKTPRIAER
jgi:hypothetical protein